MLIRMATIFFAAAVALQVLFLTTPAGARPMKECSGRSTLPQKLMQELNAEERIVFSRPERDYSRHRDAVSVTIFEAEAGGLFLPSEAGNFITLPEQTAHSNGNITVPYAGTIRAAGRTPLEVQQAIIEALRSTPR